MNKDMDGSHWTYLTKCPLKTKITQLLVFAVAMPLITILRVVVHMTAKILAHIITAIKNSNDGQFVLMYQFFFLSLAIVVVSCSTNCYFVTIHEFLLPSSLLNYNLPSKTYRKMQKVISAIFKSLN